MSASDFDEILRIDKPEYRLARDHWAFLQRWLEMVYVDSFVHGYKHGAESLNNDFSKAGKTAFDAWLESQKGTP